MNLGVGISGGNEAREDFRRISTALPGSIYAGVVKSCSLVETRAKTHHLAGATLKPHTRRLQSSVKSDVRTNGYTVKGRVGSPVVYAAIHEFGGIIRPKNAKFLTFQINGRWIRAKQVTIPKREWLLKSVQDVQPQTETLFGRQIEISIG